jgi:hypothetical membrane protein
MSSVAKAHRGLGFLFLTLAILQYFLAGIGVFGAGLESSDYDPHRIVGSLLTLIALVLLVLAAIGRREALPASGALFVLMIIQTVLAIAGAESSKFIGALHPLNGLLILFVAHQAARGLALPIGGRAPTARA